MKPLTKKLLEKTAQLVEYATQKELLDWPPACTYIYCEPQRPCHKPDDFLSSSTSSENSIL